MLFINVHHLYISIPNSVTEIGDYAFYNCSSIRNITISNNITKIGKGVFWECSSLTNITIPNSVIKIDFKAFYKCSSLTEVAIPNGVFEIEYGAFEECSSLKYISIPDSVTEIGKYAFYKCSSLTKAKISNSVAKIEYGAFEECSSLTYILIPNSVTEIGKYAFYKCSSLTNATIPKSVTIIDKNVFPPDCKIERIQNDNNIIINQNTCLIDKYEKIEQIGKSDYENVWKCRRESDGGIFAIKEIPCNKEKSEELIKGIDILSEIKNKYIVKYIEHFIDYEQEKIYIFMELCSGGDLRTFINEIKADKTYIEENKIWKFLKEISFGLFECFSKNIIHCNIKPENIFLDSECVFKLGGFEREIKDYDASTQPLYLAPEVFRGENHDERSDVWSLGCIAYEMATLHPPFESKKGKIFDLFQKIQNEDIQAFDSQGYSSNLFNIIKSMLEKDPMKRPNIKEILEISISK